MVKNSRPRPQHYCTGIKPTQTKGALIAQRAPSTAGRNTKLRPSVGVVRVIRVGVPVGVTGIRVGVPVGVHVHVGIPVSVHVHVRVHVGVGVGGCRVRGRGRRAGVGISSARVGISSRRRSGIGVWRVGIYFRRLTTSCPESCNSKQGKKS